VKPNPYTSSLTFAADGTAQAVRERRKTVTRRLAREGKGPRWRVGALARAFEKDPRTGAKAFGEVRILSVTRERLRDITADEVRREGTTATTVEEFVALFADLHGVSLELAEVLPVWRVEFRREQTYAVTP
jgi:hypothetical protein